MAQRAVLDNKALETINLNRVPEADHATTADTLTNMPLGTWNPRGTTLVKDFYCNGGDLSISETGGQISVSIDGYYYQNEGLYQCLDTNNYNSLIHPANSYGVYRFTNGTTINSSNSPTASITITTHGRPVFVGVSGDFNCYGGAAWGWCIFYRDGSEIKRQIGEGNSNSQNIPFGWFYLDMPTAGSHTYKITFSIGSGQIQLTENGTNEAPQFIVFEI